ncbi:hypothetical protein GOBAR_DD28124 [Gossypium barbadense]|nr:hypothetical protein GOBAR_DD28124 [Gossypium barbadense]
MELPFHYASIPRATVKQAFGSPFSEIQKYQQSTELLIKKLPFERLVREIAQDFLSFSRSLSPIHLRRKSARSVSYYALFQGWLLLGKPLG